MRCKFDNSQPCGMKEYLGVCACDMCKENPTKIRELKKGKQTVRAVHEREQELDVDLKNVDLTEFYNFDADVEAVIKNNLESLDKQQEKKVKQQLKREKRVEEKVEKKIEENIKEKTSIKIEDVKIIVDTDSKKFDIVQAEISQEQPVKREIKAVKIEQPIVADKMIMKKKFGILSWLKNWLFR